MFETLSISSQHSFPGFKDHSEAMDRAWKISMAAWPIETHCTLKEIPLQVHFPEKRWTRCTQDGPPHIKRWTSSIRSWLKRKVKNLRPPTTRARNVLASLVRRNLHNRSMDSRSLDSDVTIKVTQNIFRRKFSVVSYKTLLWLDNLTNSLDGNMSSWSLCGRIFTVCFRTISFPEFISDNYYWTFVYRFFMV